MAFFAATTQTPPFARYNLLYAPANHHTSPFLVLTAPEAVDGWQAFATPIRLRARFEWSAAEISDPAKPRVRTLDGVEVEAHPLPDGDNLDFLLADALSGCAYQITSTGELARLIVKTFRQRLIDLGLSADDLTVEHVPGQGVLGHLSAAHPDMTPAGPTPPPAGQAANGPKRRKRTGKGASFKSGVWI